MKRTYIIFKNKMQREKAIDFLVNTNYNYSCNVVKDENKSCFISFSPRTYFKNNIDLYLGGLFFTSFSTIK